MPGSRHGHERRQQNLRFRLLPSPGMHFGRSSFSSIANVDEAVPTAQANSFPQPPASGKSLQARDPRTHAARQHSYSPDSGRSLIPMFSFFRFDTGTAAKDNEARFVKEGLKLS